MKNEKGITLIELIIAILIFSVVIALAGSFLVSGFRNYEVIGEILTGQSNTRYVMYEISKELRNASLSDITINDTNTSINIDGVTFSYSADDLTVSRIETTGTTVIARDIAGFYVEISGETVNYSIQSTDDSAGLNSSVTLKEFTRPSPP
jgi:prepilin-type N-terminal cleavage/methylation domain-containing protein